MKLSLRRAWLLPAFVILAAAQDPSATAVTPPVYHQFLGGFVSAKGERALIMGYPPALEVWAYPLQLASDVTLRFREAGVVQPLDAAPLLHDVLRTPTEVIRTYVGPDFRVREHLFVPRQQAGAIIRYEVEGRPDVSIELSFKPSLNLMWPGALGGQTIKWDAQRSGYVESEPLHHFSATIASPQATAHDATVNRTRDLSDRLTMVLQPTGSGPGPRTATAIFALDPKDGSDGAKAILSSLPQTEQEARDHAAAVLARSLQIETPDPAVNAALESATLALDQAWACNDLLGCGELAGFGPSRPGRRPQYAWFFAGDGLIAMQAMLDSGQFDRARDELAFVTRYQDPKSGMIWHELSQSAGLIDWVGRYPYMYVHVDISFQYLAALAAYLKATGDVTFVRDHWPAIEKVWRYCTSTIDPDTGLPRIPMGKEGQDEQHQLRDDIRLSSALVGAADGIADLAQAMNDPDLAAQARDAATRARTAIAKGNWDPQRHFWLEGHTAAGAPVRSEGPGAIGVLDQHIFTERQTGLVLDRLSSPDFITPWGMRSLSASDPAYDPNAYASGSVNSLGTAEAAQVFWHHHRAATAWTLWRGLIDWNTLDSAGHLHEVAAGDFFHPEIESVPEQTWSSAGLLSAAVHGLLGLDVDAQRHEVSFAPQLPAGWHHLIVRNIAVGTSQLSLDLHCDDNKLSLSVIDESDPVEVHFTTGAGCSSSARSITLDGRPITGAHGALQKGDGEISFTAKTGRSLLEVLS